MGERKDPDGPDEGEATRNLAAWVHDEAAAFWQEHGNLERAGEEREKARKNREGAETEPGRGEQSSPDDPPGADDPAEEEGAD